MQSADLSAQFYETMLLIRRVEEHIVSVYHQNKIRTPVHLSIGQEPVAAALCAALEPDDFISNTYRGHATYLAKGGDPKALLAELYGKQGGCAGGKAGSMHIIDMQQGVLGTSAIVGTTIPVAAGVALAMKREFEKTGRQRVVVCVFGDGGTEEGSFMETINFSALHRLPILFVCENNGFAVYSPRNKRWATDLLCERIATFNLSTYHISDSNVFSVYEAAKAEIHRMKTSYAGPAFIETMTYRWLDHVGPVDDHDDDAYRNVKESLAWKNADQLKQLATLLSREQQDAIEKRVEDKLQTAINFAEQSPYPTIEELYTHVYAN